MISFEDIKTALEDCKGLGYNIGVRDVLYLLLERMVSDTNVIYKAFFGQDKGFDISKSDEYRESERINYLREYLSERKMIVHNDVNKNIDISFEENKAYMLKLKKDTEQAMEEGKIETKDGLKILADISVKLNDKFAVGDNSAPQMIVVNAKYDDICPNCHHEISRRKMTKVEAMNMYNLVEKK